MNISNKTKLNKYKESQYHLDSIVADYVSSTGKYINQSSVIDLMEWLSSRIKDTELEMISERYDGGCNE